MRLVRIPNYFLASCKTLLPKSGRCLVIAGTARVATGSGSLSRAWKSCRSTFRPRHKRRLVLWRPSGTSISHFCRSTCTSGTNSSNIAFYLPGDWFLSIWGRLPTFRDGRHIRENWYPYELCSLPNFHYEGRRCDLPEFSQERQDPGRASFPDCMISLTPELFFVVIGATPAHLRILDSAAHASNALLLGSYRARRGDTFAGVGWTRRPAPLARAAARATGRR